MGIGRGEASARLASACALHRGEQAIGVQWETLDLPLLQVRRDAHAYIRAHARIA